MARDLPSTLDYLRRRASEVDDLNRRGLRLAYEGTSADQRAALERAVGGFTERHPEFAAGAALDLALDTETTGDYWSATLWLHNPRLRAELSAALAAASGQRPLAVPQEPRHGWNARNASPGSGQPAAFFAVPQRLPMQWLSWTLLPQVYWEFNEAEQSRIPFAVQEESLAQYEAMLAEYRRWMAGHPELQQRIVDFLAYNRTRGPLEQGTSMQVTDPFDESKPGAELTVLVKHDLPLQVQIKWYGEGTGLLEDLSAGLSDAAGQVRPDFPHFMMSMPEGVL